MKKKNKKGAGYVNLPDYKRARQILADFNPQNEKYLRSLVSSITRNGAYADGLDFGALRREAFKIKGIVKKIADYEHKKPTKATQPEQLELFK